MKKYTFILVLLFLFLSCASYIKNKKPQGFTYYFKNEYTGLDTLIEVNGYYISDPAIVVLNKDTIKLRKLLLFYKNGLCNTIQGDENRIYEIINKKDKKTLITHSLGNYVVEKDTIKAQFIDLSKEFVARYSTYVKEIHYLINSPSQIELICRKSLYSGYVNYENKGLKFNFYPDDKRPDSTQWWMLDKKWFWDEDAYKRRKDK